MEKDLTHHGSNLRWCEQQQSEIVKFPFVFLSFSLSACGGTPGNFQARFQLARYSRFDLFLALFFSSTFLFLLLKVAYLKTSTANS